MQYIRDKWRDMKKYEEHHTIESIAAEPAAFYQLQNKYDRISAILGGSQQLGIVIGSDMDLIAISRKGLPKLVIQQISSMLNISMEKMSSLIHVSHRTLQRKADADLLNSYSTEQIIEIAAVISRGIEVFDTIEMFTAWCHSEIRHLDYKKPIDFFDTSFGTQLILTILGQIEHGVYA